MSQLEGQIHPDGSFTFRDGDSVVVNTVKKDGIEGYDWYIEAAVDQKTVYQGAFQTLDDAIDKLDDLQGRF